MENGLLSIPKEKKLKPAFLLALAVHVALVAFLWIGVSWQADTGDMVEAEVWDIKVREAAPLAAGERSAQAAAEPVPERATVSEPEPPSAPKQQAAPEPVRDTRPDIALEQEKKQAADKKRAEMQRQQEEKARMKKEAEEAKKKRLADAAAAKKARALLDQEARRIAGGGSGGGKGKGSGGGGTATHRPDGQWRYGYVAIFDRTRKSRWRLYPESRRENQVEYVVQCAGIARRQSTGHL